MFEGLKGAISQGLAENLVKAVLKEANENRPRLAQAAREVTKSLVDRQLIGTALQDYLDEMVSKWEKGGGTP